MGLAGRVEDVQPVLQRRGRRVIAPRFGPVGHRRGDPLGAVGEGESQAVERGQLAVPGRGLAVGRVAAEDGRHARRLDRRPGSVAPKKDLVDGQGLDAVGTRRVQGRQDRAGPSGLGLDPVPQGRMVGDLVGGQEQAEEVLDLPQAQAHGEGGGGQPPLRGLVDDGPALGGSLERGDHLEEPLFSARSRLTASGSGGARRVAARACGRADRRSGGCSRPAGPGG